MISTGELVLRKFLETLVALFALVFLSFLFMHLLPGGPFDQDASFNPVVKESMGQLWALNEPFWLQCAHYFRNIFSGDLGQSIVHGQTTVSSILARGFLQTVSLSVWSLGLSFGGAFLSSLLSILYSKSLCFPFFESLSLLGISLPSLFLGPVLIYFFGFYWNLLPTAFLTSPAHYVLPVITLSLRPWAQLHLLLTTNLTETMNLDFIRTAKAKGLSKFGIVSKHAFKNSLLPLLALSGPLIASLISGSFLVEILFSIHGLGQQFADSLNQRDYPVILGLVLVYGVTMIVLTNIFETIALWTDPRIREDSWH